MFAVVEREESEDRHRVVQVDVVQEVDRDCSNEHRERASVRKSLADIADYGRKYDKKLSDSKPHEDVLRIGRTFGVVWKVIVVLLSQRWSVERGMVQLTPGQCCASASLLETRRLE